MNMRIIFVLFIAGLLACTKTNPNVCCTDPADCSSAGIPTVQGCGDALACRGHVCVAETCSSSRECTADAPYCETPNGLCELTCSNDNQCPGGSQTADDIHCVGGACVQCRAEVAADCSGATPVCEGGVCRGCTEHTDCASGVCAADGSCAASGDISYVAVAGTINQDCSQFSPCSLAKALTLAHLYVVIDSGNYANAGTIVLSNGRWLIGRGTRPVLTNPMHGPIIQLNSGANVRLANLQISDATASSSLEGDGVDCQSDGQPANRSLVLDNMLFLNNSGIGVLGHTCTVAARRSAFRSNGSGGMQLADLDSTIDRCEFSGNAGYAGLYTDGGVVHITNVFAFHNAKTGIDSESDKPGNVIEFSTIVDNGGAGLVLGSPGATASNNIIARNTMGPVQCANPPCTYTGSIVSAGNDVTTLHFVSPDTQPYDYHLTAGSVAIDAATTATLDHDFDGEARPKGGGRDVGADEAQ